MLELENIVSIHKTKLHDKGYDILFNDGRIIWVIKRRAIVGLLLLIKYEICSEEDLTGTNDRLQTIKRILKNKIPSDWIQERYGDANKPFSELWTEEGFSCVRAEGLSGNRKYMLSKNDHELLFNVNAKNTRISIGKLDKEIILKQQGYLVIFVVLCCTRLFFPKLLLKIELRLKLIIVFLLIKAVKILYLIIKHYAIIVISVKDRYALFALKNVMTLVR
ncbi:Uncharacterised protein [Helicobacter pylori]|nr:hypothetical protein [Helicobacter pylori]STO91312.1 Uncharacterised protein [Helicobacter pylori]STO91321.1 Uncharacterised protein [Helicobacter pylori]